MPKIAIRSEADIVTWSTATAFNPVVLSGLGGVYIHRIHVVASRQPDADFLLSILPGCEGLFIGEVILHGAFDDSTRESWREQAPSGLLIQCRDVLIGRVILSNLHIGVRLEADGAMIESGIATNLSGDLGQTCADDCHVMGISWEGSLNVLGSSYHRDVWQYFPLTKGGVLRGSSVSGLQYRAGSHAWDAMPQGILATDGRFDSIVVAGCDLQGVHPAHGISFLTPANNCQLSGNTTNGLIRIARRGNTVSGNRATVQFIDCNQSKGVVMSNKMILSDALAQDAANQLGCEVASVRAVVAVESQGDPDALLFERHKFLESLQKLGKDIAATLRDNPGAEEIISTTPYKKGRCGKDCYGTHAKQAERLAWARRINPEAANMATSFGHFQIMGFNFKSAGYGSVAEFVEAMREPEEQVRAFVRLVIAQGLDDALRRKDWTAFAKGYNGKNYRGDPATKEDDYDWRLAREYQRIIAVGMPKKPKSKSKTVVASTVGAATLGSAVGGVAAVSDVLDQMHVVIASMEGVKTGLQELSGQMDALAWLPWMVGGTFVLVMLLFALVVYSYLQDHGYIGE